MELPEVVYDVRVDGWRLRNRTSYDMTAVISKRAAIAHLSGVGQRTEGEAKLLLSTFREQWVIYGADLRPGLPAVFPEGEMGRTTVNLWVRPTLVPKAGPWPAIDRVLRWVTNGDERGREYLLQFFARKIQQPELLPKVAVIFSTAQGAGKNFLYRVLAEILGPDNCASVTQGEFEARFTGRHARALLKLGDEVLSNETIRDSAQRLKILIDSPYLELEKKFENQITIRNQTMWLFASNCAVSPLSIEATDRRYTVFTNFSPVTAEYATALSACFESDRTTMTPAFLAEIAGFAQFLLEYPVDIGFVSRPYQNSARDNLITVSQASQDAFFREMELQGFDGLWESYMDRDFTLRDTDREEWDFGEGGVAVATLYRLYRAYCKDSGFFTLRLNKFGGALKNHVPQWETHRRTTKRGRQIRCYVVPRKPASP